MESVILLVLPSLKQFWINNNRKTTPRTRGYVSTPFPSPGVRTGLSQGSLGEAKTQLQHMSPRPDSDLLVKQAFGKYGTHLSPARASPKVPFHAHMAELCSTLFRHHRISRCDRVPWSGPDKFSFPGSSGLCVPKISRYASTHKDESWQKKNKRFSQRLGWWKNWKHG